MRRIDIHQVADEARFNRFHGLVLFWCALIIIFDGYDLAVAGIALPSIMKQMGVDPKQAGFMVSSALFGMMFGAIQQRALQRLDGAALAHVDRGVEDRDPAQSRVELLSRSTPASFVAFDLIAIDGRSLMGESFRVRRRRLEAAASSWVAPLASARRYAASRSRC